METHQPKNDPKEISPQEKKKRVHYITAGIVGFLILVLVLMFANMDRDAEDLPSHATQEQVQQAQE